jgi:shikimate kinase
MRQGRLLFLIGYRGSGKTTVARLLAERLHWQWRDADDALEKRFGRSICTIFAEEGESGFRDKEAHVLAELCTLTDHVIATGGGVVLRPENRQRLRASGRVVWLTGDPRVLWQRMQADATSRERRPVLTQGGLAEIEELVRIRAPMYTACADITVDTTTRSPQEVTDVIYAHHGLRTADYGLARE